MIVPFEAEHLSKIKLQNAQLSVSDMLNNPDYAKMLEGTNAWTLIDGDEVLCCGGMLKMWEGRSVAWALMSANAGRKFMEIHRNVAAAFRMCPDRRVEIAVDSEFPQGKRWAKMLGLTYEGTMKGYGVDGRDHDLYARVKGV
jgi:hypothetical protein